MYLRKVGISNCRNKIMQLLWAIFIFLIKHFEHGIGHDTDIA